MGSFTLLRIAASMVALAVALGLLTYADGSARDVLHDALAPTLLSISFISMMIVLALTSVSRRLHFGLQMLAIYFAIYLLLPGYHHATMNEFPFYDMEYRTGVIRGASLIVTWFLASALLAYTFGHVRSPPLARAVFRRDNFRIRANILLASSLLAFSVVAMGAYLSSTGIAGAFAIRSETVSVDGAASSAGLLRSLPRVMTFISFLYAIVLFRFGSQRLMGILFVTLNLPVFLIVNWPLGLARFVLFGYILMIVILTVNMRSVVGRLGMTMGFVLGALGAMPILNAITRDKGNVANFSYDRLLGSYFASGDFDGLQSINNAVIYVNIHGVIGGRQLMSAILFFVPRAIWPGKGEPTGTLTAEAAGFSFLNISQPLPSEFYVDFGMTGVIVGGMLVGFGLCRADQWIDRNWDGGPGARLMAGLIVAYSIIVYRGSLLGIVATIVALILGGALIVYYGLQTQTRPARRSLVRPIPPAAAIAGSAQ